ncbi:Hypothetical predicted protein [Pelobates cultripes]|uniref:Uncharacterized protein n=1 Tax=Pelobates cultripes TaxID=61616 RepID=A0AAD1VU26_PELCU|nr:Hypothetical predicted protein [Pelobates cultripes]
MAANVKRSPRLSAVRRTRGSGGAVQDGSAEYPAGADNGRRVTRSGGAVPARPPRAEGSSHKKKPRNSLPRAGETETSGRGQATAGPATEPSRDRGARSPAAPGAPSERETSPPGEREARTPSEERAPVILGPTFDKRATNPAAPRTPCESKTSGEITVGLFPDKRNSVLVATGALDMAAPTSGSRDQTCISTGPSDCEARASVASGLYEESGVSAPVPTGPYSESGDRNPVEAGTSGVGGGKVPVAAGTSLEEQVKDYRVRCFNKQIVQDVLEMCTEFSKEVVESQQYLGQERREQELKNCVWDFQTLFQENVSINGQSWHEAAETQNEPDLKILEDKLDDLIVDTTRKRKKHPRKILAHVIKVLKTEREILVSILTVKL